VQAAKTASMTTERSNPLGTAANRKCVRMSPSFESDEILSAGKLSYCGFAFRQE